MRRYHSNLMEYGVMETQYTGETGLNHNSQMVMAYRHKSRQ